jgi:hypothetical protein
VIAPLISTEPLQIGDRTRNSLRVVFEHPPLLCCTACAPSRGCTPADSLVPRTARVMFVIRGILVAFQATASIEGRSSQDQRSPAAGPPDNEIRCRRALRLEL